MKKSSKKIIITSFFSSLVIVFTFIKIPIYLGEIAAMIHFGNVMCLLSGLILGSIYGGIASGLGSFIFDLLSPEYFSSSIFSLFFKFLMAFFCGLNYKKSKNKYKLFISLINGSLIYMILHLTKIFIFNKYILNLSVEASAALLLWSFIVSLFNAILSVIVSKIIYKEVFQRLKIGKLI